MYKMNASVLPEIFFYGTIVHTGSWGHAEVRKPHHLLVLANSGIFEVSFSGKSYPMTKDYALLIPSNTPYSLKSEGTIEHLVVHFDADIFVEDAIDGARDDDLLLPAYIKSDVAMRLNAERAAALGTDDKIARIERKVALLRSLLAMAALNENSREGQLVKKMKRYLEERMQGEVSLSELSDAFGYTKQYLIRVFKHETGRSPISYFNELKLARATAELLNGEKSIAEVANSCGFNDYNYFSRAFRRRYGISAREYRKKRLSV